jgi:BASS family bile acid:Na+ symporter
VRQRVNQAKMMSMKMVCSIIALLIISETGAFKTSTSPSFTVTKNAVMINPFKTLPIALNRSVKIKMTSTASTDMVPSDIKSNKVLLLLDKVTNLFPLWVLSFSVLGYIKPTLFTWFSPFITPALALTMMCMGMTLTVSDFKRVITTPEYVLVGFLAQYSIMPFAAAGLAKLFQLGPELSAGLILVGCAPGGTASNLVTMIAKADLALSVLMTAASTVAAVFMTPFLTSKLAGSYVKVKASELVLSTLNVVLAPIVVGLGVNTFAPKISQKIAKYTPFLSVLLVSAICGTISASNAGVILGVAPIKLISAIVSLHSIGFLLGYFLAKVIGAGESRSRTIRLVAVSLSFSFSLPLSLSLSLSLSHTQI